MKSNKQPMARTSRAPKQHNGVKEMYERFELRSGDIPKEARISPREFGKQLASDLIDKIDREVTVKK